MSKIVNFTTVDSVTDETFQFKAYVMPADENNATFAKRVRCEVTSIVTGDDGSIKKFTRTMRMQSSSIAGDGDADGSNGTSPAPFTKGNGTILTNGLVFIRALIKDWRLLVNDDDEA